MVKITLLYAAVLAAMSIVLSARAGFFRGKVRVSILYGDPQNAELAQRVRVHQNFLEYVPLLLILMGGIELSGGNPLFLYVVGTVLILARIAHALGLKHDNIEHPLRAVGAGSTALLMLACIVYALILALA